MRKFIIEVLVLAVAVFATVGFLHSREKGALAESIARIDEPLTVINLGTSHGCSFDYSMIAPRGGAFNKAGNTLYYDLQNYLYLKRHLKPGAVVIVPVSYYVFGLDENRTDRGPENGFENEFYDYLPKHSIHGYTDEKRRRLRIHRIQRNFRTIVGLEKTRTYAPWNPEGLEQGEYLAAHAVVRGEHHRQLADFRSPERNQRYLATLVRDALESGFQPVLMTTPYSKAYNDEFSEAWLDEHYYSIMGELRDRYGIPYLDYSHDPRFSPDPLMFGDSDHLSMDGKRKFNQIMWRELVKMGWLRDDDVALQ